MSVPFYVPPEQMIKDKADYARKNIAKGRDLVACSAAEGIVIVAENQFRTLYKISEIYDRIAFGGVGKYNEFENLRVLGVRQADLKGYQFSREDVGARALANAYGADARAGVHPRDEALRGGDPARRGRHHPGRGQAVPHHLRRHGHGRRGLHRARRAAPRRSPKALGTRFQQGMGADAAIRLVRGAAGRGPEGTLGPDQLEVAILDRARARRAFRRIEGAELERHPRRLAVRARLSFAAPPRGTSASTGPSTATITSDIATTHGQRGRRRGSAPASHHSLGAAIAASTSPARST